MRWLQTTFVDNSNESGASEITIWKPCLRKSIEIELWGYHVNNVINTWQIDQMTN